MAPKITPRMQRFDAALALADGLSGRLCSDHLLDAFHQFAAAYADLAPADTDTLICSLHDAVHESGSGAAEGPIQ